MERERRVRQLQTRIAECARYRERLERDVTRIEASSESAAEREEHLRRCLGERSLDEWRLLYDVLAREARDELQALERQLPLGEQRATRLALIGGAAASIAFLFVLTLLLPTPIAALQGGAVASGGLTALGLGAAVFLLVILGLALLLLWERGRRGEEGRAPFA